MTAQEAIELINAAKAAGIRELRFGELQFIFDGDLRMAQLAMGKPQLERSGMEYNPALEFQIKSEELENLKLNDPVAYEQFVARDRDIA